MSKKLNEFLTHKEYEKLKELIVKNCLLLNDLSIDNKELLEDIDLIISLLNEDLKAMAIIRNKVIIRKKRYEPKEEKCQTKK